MSTIHNIHEKTQVSYEYSIKPLPQAVCLIMEFNGVYVAVSRPNENRMWGFPGGKVDPGESILQAILREVKEEIGLDIEAKDVVAVYRDLVEGDVSYITTAYNYVGRPIFWTEMKAEEGLLIAYQRKDIMLSELTSPFHRFNAAALQAIEDTKG